MLNTDNSDRRFTCVRNVVVELKLAGDFVGLGSRLEAADSFNALLNQRLGQLTEQIEALMKGHLEEMEGFGFRDPIAVARVNNSDQVVEETTELVQLYAHLTGEAQ